MALKWITNVQKVSNFQADVTVETNGQTVVTWGKSYVRGMDMLLVMRNGVEQSSFDEKDDYSIEFVPDYLEIGDEIRIYYIPSTLSLGEIRVAGSSADLHYLVDAQYNELALCIQDKKFFINKGNRWEEFILPFTTQNVGVMFGYESQNITDPTLRTITLTKISYTMDANALLVFVDGKLIDPSLFTEVDQRTILFKQDLPVDPTKTTHILDIVAGNTDTWEDSNNHVVTYQYNPDDSIASEVIKVGTNTVKTTFFEYDVAENIVRETIIKGDKTIIKDYTYDVKGNISGIVVAISG
jgi:hypothetical protein